MKKALLNELKIYYGKKEPTNQLDRLERAQELYSIMNDDTISNTPSSK